MFALTMRRRRWIGVGLVALVVRLAYVAGTSPRKLPLTDSWHYQHQANLLADGRGFISPGVLLFTGRSVPTAIHQPLYPLVLAAGSLFGARSVLSHQIIGCVIGVGTVLGVGLVANRVGGEWAGLLAAAIAAVYPPLWINDGGLMAEGLFALLIAGVILASYRFVDRPSVRSAAVVGLTIGLAILTRAEAVLLFLVLVLPLVVVAKQVSARRQFLLFAVAVVVGGLVVSPWVIRNLVTFERPVTLGTGDYTLEGANCRPAYYGSGIGLWWLNCYPSFTVSAVGDESVSAAAERRAGLTYARHHLDRVPLVVAVRAARIWQLYAPIQDNSVNRDDGRPVWANLAGLGAYACLVPFAVGGGWVLRRRDQRLLPLVAQLVGVTLTAALVWGGVRFRAPAEVVLAVLGGVALDAIWRWNNAVTTKPGVGAKPVMSSTL